MRTRACSTLVLALLLCASCGRGRDQLLADLQSPRPETRAQAVKELAKQGRAEDLALFTQAAKDLTPVVRSEAAVALGSSQDPRVVDLLGELLEDPDEEVQSRAAMSLSEVKGDKAKAYLTLQYARRGPRTRQAIVQALRAASVPNPMTTAVAAESHAIWDRNLLTLNEGSLAERVGAAEELGKSGKPEAVDRLLTLVRDPQVVLAAAAVRGLGEADDARAVGQIAVLLDESFPELRTAASAALLKLQDPVVVQKLAAVALERSSASAGALAAIAGLPRSPESDAALCRIALDGAPTDALDAGRAMRARGGCPIEPVVERLGKPATQESALRTLAGLGPTAAAALPRVLPLISQTDTDLRVRAIEAAAALGDAAAAGPVLLKAYAEEVAAVQPLQADWVSSPLPLRYGAGFDPAAPAPSAHPEDSHSAKQAALFDRLKTLNAARARARGQAPASEPLPPTELVDDVPESKLRVLSALLRSLGALRVDGALAALKPHAQDPSPALRTAALVGLARLGGEGTGIAAKALLEPDREVQKELALALSEQGEAGRKALVSALPQLGPEKVIVLEALYRTSVPADAAPALAEVVKAGGTEAGIAALLLGRLKARDAVPTLVAALADPTAAARRELLTALGEIGERSAAEAVARDLYSDTPDVRAAAAGALTTLGSGAQVEALDALKSDYYREVRLAAERALARINSGAAEATR
ncbi:HEAT repeat domain-containing protein [Aggregicoccus sp. 17bor-14]|uniref:HEAT repeat domain-containing protein n=1 Tax=Myxococcaceae TaxID=31 RepID=UPI00129CD97E|nr:MULTISPECIES: HEAT repeat domain-containing protein [Myxococcaceae]MBF5040917.1 HEAT repeat domain-containing protein [Simulacricoccus sp. 17bor-14]MRI86705.1 HEAT repeat domain-containing protein [Aggregicoccus sp. 17bor-14]